RSRADAEDVVRDARLCEQGREGRPLLPRRGEVQGALRDARLPGHVEPRRRLDVAGGLRADDEADKGRRGQGCEAPEAGTELTMEFEDLGERTKLTQTMRFETTEQRDTTMQYGVEEGAKQGFARVDALLKRIAA